MNDENTEVRLTYGDLRRAEAEARGTGYGGTADAIKALCPAAFAVTLKDPKDPKIGEIWSIVSEGKVYVLIVGHAEAIEIAGRKSFWDWNSESIRGYTPKFLASSLKEYLANGGKVE